MPRSTKNQEAGAAVEDREPPAAETSRRNSRPAAHEAPRENETPSASPTYDDIARRAYELYQQRGATDGQEWDDWLRAETELNDGRGRQDDEK